MANIPRRQITNIGLPRSAPASLESIGNAGIIGNEISRFGDQLSKIKRQDEDNSAFRLAASFDREFADEQIKYRQLKGTDSYGGQDRLDTYEKKALETYTANIKSPYVKERFKAHVNQRITNAKDRYAVYEQGQRAIVGRSTRDDILNTTMNNAFLGTGDLEENLGIVERLGTTQALNGELSDEEAANWIVAAKGKVAERTLAGIAQNNPDYAIEIIESGEYDSLMDSKTIESYRAEAIKEKKRQATLAENEFKAQRKLQQDEAVKTLTEMLIDGSITRTAVQKVEGFLSADQFSKWMTKEDSYQKNKHKEISEAEQNSLESDYFLRANDITNEDDFAVYKRDVAEEVKAGKLKPSKARALINDVDIIKNGDPERKAAITEGKRIIDKAFTDGLFGRKSDPESGIERSKTLLEFRKWAVTNQDKDPLEYIEKIMEPTKASWVKEILTLGFAGGEIEPAAQREAIKNEQTDKFITEARRRGYSEEDIQAAIRRRQDATAP